MIVPSKNQKTYGVIHTENYFSFLGFCKKVNSDKIQKVDIFVNDTLIDTIVADKHIEKIEDIYELEGFGFEYILPNEYIGQKSLISFKNHETKEDLQNSPYELIDETHPKFNEARFLNSLEKPINKEFLRNNYCSNSIVFLVTEENLKDLYFINCLNTFAKKYSDWKFIAYYFDENLKKISETLLVNEFEFVYLQDLMQILENNYLIILNVHSQIDNQIFQVKKGKILHLHINSFYKEKNVDDDDIESSNSIYNNYLNVKPFYKGMTGEKYSNKLLDLYISFYKTDFNKKILEIELKN